MSSSFEHIIFYTIVSFLSKLKVAFLGGRGPILTRLVSNSPCNEGWLWTDPPASTSHTLGLQTCTILYPALKLPLPHAKIPTSLILTFLERILYKTILVRWKHRPVRSSQDFTHLSACIKSVWKTTQWSNIKWGKKTMKDAVCWWYVGAPEDGSICMFITHYYAYINTRDVNTFNSN